MSRREIQNTINELLNDIEAISVEIAKTRTEIRAKEKEMNDVIMKDLADIYDTALKSPYFKNEAIIGKNKLVFSFKYPEGTGKIKFDKNFFTAEKIPSTNDALSKAKAEEISIEVLFNNWENIREGLYLCVANVLKRELGEKNAALDKEKKKLEELGKLKEKKAKSTERE